MRATNNVLAIFLTIALLVTLTIPSSAFAYVEPNTPLPDGTYDVEFDYVKDGTNDPSAADTFMVHDGAKLIIINGKAMLEHKVTKNVYKTFEYLGTRKSGADKAVITNENNETVIVGMEGYQPVQVREEGDYVILSLAIEDVWQKQDALIHINDKEDSFGLGSIYNHWYNVQIVIYTSNITIPEDNSDGENGNGNDNDSQVSEDMVAKLIAEGYQLHEEAVEGEYDGAYPVNSKETLLSKLQLAESLVAEAAGNSDMLKAVYTIVKEAIIKFKNSKVVVDKTALIDLIAEATEWVEGKADAGVHETGIPSDIKRFAVAHGEYLPQTFYGREIGYKGPVTEVKEKIAEAQLVVDDQFASNSQVTAAYNNLSKISTWELYEKQRLIAQDIELLVLDSLEKDANISPYADEISSNAVLLQQAGPGYYQTFAHIAFYDHENKLTDSSIRQASTSNGGYNSWISTAAPRVNHVDVSNTPQFKAVLEGENADVIKVFQTQIRAASISDDVWLGLWRLQYPTELPEAERKTIYISFNKAYLEELQQLIEDANALLANAEEGIAVGQHSAHYIQLLKTAIADAKEVAEQLSADRPTILKAKANLQEAIDTFVSAETKLSYVTTAEADKDAFSSFQQYFDTPALVKTNDEGEIQVGLTVKDSSHIAALKIKDGEQFTAANVEKDEASGTRTFSFKTNSLSQLLDAQLQVVDQSQSLDQTYNIRLNFNNVNNTQLYELIVSAQAAYNKVASSDSNNQNYTVALDALARAIQRANEEATRMPSQQATTDEAYQALNSALNIFNDTTGGGTDPNPSNPSNPTNPTNPGDPVYPANGYYLMPFHIYKYGTTNSSVAETYVVTEALVKVQGNSKTVMFTVLRSKEITGLKINGSSGSVVSSDSKKNQRVVSFTLNDLSQTLDGWVKVDWPEVNYHYSYDIQFKFDEGAAIYISDPQVPGADFTPDAPGLPHPGGTTEQTDEEKADKDEQATETETSTNNGESTTNESTSSVTTKNVEFSDIENHWAKTSITRAVRLGIVTGYADGTFRPNATVTRGEFAVMLSRALKLDGNGKTTFSDAANIPNWAKEHVGRIVTAGLIQGFADGSFRAEGQLSRTQLAVIVARAAKLNTEEAISLSFKDAADIPSWAQKEVAAAVKAGLISGKGNNLFDGNGIATRADALTIIIRLLDYLSKN